MIKDIIISIVLACWCTYCLTVIALYVYLSIQACVLQVLGLSFTSSLDWISTSLAAFCVCSSWVLNPRDGLQSGLPESLLVFSSRQAWRIIDFACKPKNVSESIGFWSPMWSLLAGVFVGHYHWAERRHQNSRRSYCKTCQKDETWWTFHLPLPSKLTLCMHTMCSNVLNCVQTIFGILNEHHCLGEFTSTVELICWFQMSAG